MNTSSSTRCGFTIIEMLVAISILSFMLLMMVQMTGLAEQAWRTEQNRIDNFTKARSMVDMVSDDLQRAVIRPDLPIFNTNAPAATPTATASGLYYFPAPSSAPATPSFTTAFYTRLPGVPSSSSTAVRDVSLVSYALMATNSVDKIVLQRSDLAVPWSSSQNILFQGGINTVLNNAPATAREVAPGVVGFHLAFRQANGNMIDQSQYTGYCSTNAVVAVDIGVAVIGKESLAVLTPQQIQQLQGTFTGTLSFTGTGTLGNGVKASWDQTLAATGFYSQYPKPLAGGLKTFERWVACPPF